MATPELANAQEDHDALSDMLQEDTKSNVMSEEDRAAYEQLLAENHARFKKAKFKLGETALGDKPFPVGEAKAPTPEQFVDPGYAQARGDNHNFTGDR